MSRERKHIIIRFAIFAPMLIAMAIGALIISILTIPGWIKSRQMRSKHRKEVAELEDNLSKYRSNLVC